MGSRKKYWYTIVTYIPSTIRYERINVGVIMGSPDDKKIFFKFLPSNSKKIRCFCWNSLEKKLYKNINDYISFLLNRAIREDTLFNLPRYDNSISWSDWLNADLPDGVSFSKIHYALTSNSQMVFNNLVDTYVGNQFFAKNSSTSMLKAGIAEIFREHDLIGKKLRSNVKIKPDDDLPLKIEIDYAYLEKENRLPSLIQITPKKDSLIDWYKNTFTLLKKNKESFRLNILTDINDYENHGKTLMPLLEDIASDSRVEPIYMSSARNKDHFESLINNIKKSEDISNWSAKELLA